MTVGIPVFNAEEYLPETLEALRVQKLDDLEVVISDNGSTDGTEEICRDLAGKDSRFSYHRSPVNRGITWNFNRVLDLATAPAFMWNCADDVADPEHLLRCCDLLDERPEAPVAFARVLLVDQDGEKIGELDDLDLSFEGLRPSERVNRYLVRHAYQVVGFGGVIRTPVLRSLGGLPAFYGGDVLLGIRLALLGELAQVPDQLYRQRRHEKQMNKLQGGDPVEQQLAYAPERRLRTAFPQWRLNAEMLSAIATAPVPTSERLAASAAVIRRWTVPNWRFFPFDVKRNGLRLLKGKYRGAYFG